MSLVVLLKNDSFFLKILPASLLAEEHCFPIVIFAVRLYSVDTERAAIAVLLGAAQALIQGQPL